MKLKFKTQSYQTASVKAVADCFAGQPNQTGIQYRIDPGKVAKGAPQQHQMLDDAGFRNADFAIPASQLLTNIQAVQRSQNLPQSSELVNSKPCDINLDIEMETGTGKTYCYIKSIFELNKQYGCQRMSVPRRLIHLTITSTRRNSRRCGSALTVKLPIPCILKRMS
jgi:type III restriction enzyme